MKLEGGVQNRERDDEDHLQRNKSHAQQDCMPESRILFAPVHARAVMGSCKIECPVVASSFGLVQPRRKTLVPAGRNGAEMVLRAAPHTTAVRKSPEVAANGFAFPTTLSLLCRASTGDYVSTKGVVCGL